MSQDIKYLPTIEVGIYPSRTVLELTFIEEVPGTMEEQIDALYLAMVKGARGKHCRPGVDIFTSLPYHAETSEPVLMGIPVMEDVLIRNIYNSMSVEQGVVFALPRTMKVSIRNLFREYIHDGKYEEVRAHIPEALNVEIRNLFTQFVMDSSDTEIQPYLPEAAYMHIRNLYQFYIHANEDGVSLYLLNMEEIDSTCTSSFYAPVVDLAYFTGSGTPPDDPYLEDVISIMSLNGDTFDSITRDFRETSGTLTYSNDAKFATSSFMSFDRDVDVMIPYTEFPSNTPYCMEAWILIGPSQTGGRLMTSDRSWGSGGQWFIVVDASGIPGFRRESGAGGELSFSALSAVNDNSWHHIALTFDGSFLRMFVDGVLEGNAPDTLGYYQSLKPLRIGRSFNDNYPSGRAAFSGNISEVRITVGSARYLTTFEVNNNPFPIY